MAPASLFDQVGETTLRKVIKDFYDQVFIDPMIGFFFMGKNKAHLIDREYEMAARMLGGDVRYAGKPMRAAHAGHRIFGGHFERRLKLLEEAMDRAGLLPEVKATWLATAGACATRSRLIEIQIADPEARPGSRLRAIPPGNPEGSLAP